MDRNASLKLSTVLRYIVADLQQIRAMLRQARAKLRECARRAIRPSLFAAALLALLSTSLVLPEVASASPSHAHRTPTSSPSRHPNVCPGGPQLPPTPSIGTLAFLAEPSTNTVETLNMTTGALVGTAITVGTTPLGAAYWRPLPGSASDPEVIVPNSANHSVSIIDAVSRTVLATVNIPSGSSGEAVAASPSSPYALVVDVLSGKVSVINLTNNTDAGEISLAGSNVLSSVAFSSNGAYAYVTDPSQHKIFALQFVAGTAPYFSALTTWTNSNYNPTGIATDLTNSGSTNLYVTNSQVHSGSTSSLVAFSDASGALGTPTLIRNYTVATMGSLTVDPGEVNAYVAQPAQSKVDQIVIASGSATSITTSTTLASPGAIGLSADGLTLLGADTSAASLQEASTASLAATNTVTTNAAVAAIATALPPVGSWNAYVITSGTSTNVDVINTGTSSITNSFYDSHTPEAVVASPDGQYVYIANTNSVSVIATADVGVLSNPIVATITGIQGTQPSVPTLNGIAISPSGDALLVSDSTNGAVDVIDLNSADSAYRTVVQRLGLDGSGNHSTSQTTYGAMAFSPDGAYGYVTEYGFSSSTHDGVTVLAQASTTAAGYTYNNMDFGLSQNSNALNLPQTISVSPNGETAYVSGTNPTNSPYAGLFRCPLTPPGKW